MSEENILTKGTAEQFLEDETFDLSDFTRIKDEAAKSLSQTEGELDELTTGFA